jgi:hypothetical protein
MPIQFATIPKKPTTAVEKRGANTTAVKPLKRSEYATATPGRKISPAAVNKDGIADDQDRVPPKGAAKRAFGSNPMTSRARPVDRDPALTARRPETISAGPDGFDAGRHRGAVRLVEFPAGRSRPSGLSEMTRSRRRG